MEEEEEMTLYADVIWLLNLCIDYLLIALTAILLKRPFQQFRFICASFVASLIVVFMFTPVADFFLQPIVKGLYSALIVWIAFGYQRWRFFLQALFMFYFVTFMTGGGLFALHYFWQTEIPFFTDHSLTSGSFGSGISWLFVCLGFPLVWYFSKQRLETIEVKKVQYERLVDVEVWLEQSKLTIRGIIDSGNQLQDPFTKAPVMIIQADVLRGQIPDEWIEQMLNVESIGTTDGDERFMRRMSVIPYRVVGQPQRLLAVFKPDSVRIRHEEEWMTVSKVLIGLNNKALSPEDTYQCIVHPKMIVHGITDKLA
jgi:stage II sporulation protein GA (sporulation sigma-E factor processing peptidase)